PAGLPPSAAGCDAQSDDETPPIACYSLDQNLDISPISVNENETDPAYTDPERHRQIWNFTRSILPKTILKEETRQYHIFTDGPDETLAFVSPLPDDPYHWFVAVDIEDAPNPIGPDKEFVHTIIHEFAHILTLRSAQVPPDPDAGTGAMEDDSPTETELSCPNFFTGEGCAEAQSYINLFFDRFWADIYDEFLDLDAAETEEEYSDLAYEFYQTYQDRFVTEYAATNPGEDIAESFTFFVLKDKPAGDSIADQKVRFFYAFPELVKMRNQIRGQLARAGR
ncbi:MAG: hypothetical protein D6768_05875, partial [Chloroflexi bacterium]